VDELFEAGRTSTVLEDRQAAYNEVQEILMDELPWIPFYHLNLVAGMNKRVVDGGSIVNVWNRPYNWNIEKVSIAAE
jgi:peptide/nickel transport system substrate-binding protein